MKFINRQTELTALNNWWKQNMPHLVIIYGKRRVGKTELIKQFIKDKPSVYFLADKVSDIYNLKMLSKKTGSFFKDAYIEEKGIDEWYHFFNFLKNKKKRMIVVIDEFPYLVESNKAISSIFQKGWDEYLKDAGIFLILSGSSIGMMEQETLAHEAPLYGRRTGQILLRALRFGDFAKFFPNKKFDELLKIHTITGGIPAYILQFGQGPSLKNIIKKRLLSPQGYLYDEVEFILKEELREPRTYLSILKSIALGKRKFGEIVNDTGLEKNVIMKYLHVLEELHLIRKEIPVTEGAPLRSKRGIYFLQDQFFTFWFNYIFPFKSELELGRQDNAMSEFDKTFEALVAQNYERIAVDILLDNSISIFPLLKTGRWWVSDDEIDIVGLNEKENKILFGEVKWSNKKVGTNIYEDLKHKAQKVEWGKKDRREYFCLFSKSGFTPGMKIVAKKEKVFLFEKDKIL